MHNNQNEEIYNDTYNYLILVMLLINYMEKRQGEESE